MYQRQIKNLDIGKRKCRDKRKVRKVLTGDNRDHGERFPYKKELDIGNSRYRYRNNKNDDNIEEKEYDMVDA